MDRRRFYGRLPRCCGENEIERLHMTFGRMTKAIVTDIHFLIPLAVLCIGCALLMKVY